MRSFVGLECFVIESDLCCLSPVAHDDSLFDTAFRPNAE